jgi:hypothetical protein
MSALQSWQSPKRSIILGVAKTRAGKYGSWTFSFSVKSLDSPSVNSGGAGEEYLPN